MPERVRLEKNFFSFNQGLNTDSSEIAFPDGFSTDERNYELLLDGSRRRRRGLAQESGGSDKDITSDSNFLANQTYVWKNVGGDPEKTFIVHKFSSTLYFSDDAETISTTYHADKIDLEDFQLGSTFMVSTRVSFTDGRGYLIVTGKGIAPLIIEYRSATDDFLVSEAYPIIRDYSDQVDGLTTIQYGSTLSDALRYNLINRGWTQTDIDAYNSGASQYPNKSVPWFKAYKETADQSVAASTELIGTRTFDHALYTSQPPTASSARKGSLFITPQDSTYGASEASAVQSITAMSYVDNGSTWEVTITTGAAHGLGVGVEIEIKGTSSLIQDAHGNTIGVVWDGTYTTKAGTTGSTVVVDFTEPGYFSSMVDFDNNMGTVSTDAVITRDSGSVLGVGPSACAFHDGRLFTAGIYDNDWSDYLFFSQIPTTKDKFNKCYQVADPTDPENNQLVDTDGGYLVLQGIQGVQQLLSVRNSLLVFAENGVWEVSGGERGFFTPSGYSVRKITNAGCNSKLSPIAIENNAIYTGPEGIFFIGPNQYTGILEAQSLTQNKIQDKWNAIPEEEQKRVMTVYDDAQKRVFFLYGKNSDLGVWSTSNETFYDQILILNFLIPAWTYFKYNTAANTGIMSAFAISYTSSTDQKNKIKFSCAVTDSNTVRTCDHDQSDYIDFDGSESPLPYVVTGWDNIGDFQRRRQAPVITVYAKRTETGYTDSGSGWSGDNESSNLMTAYWDWTNDDVSGKIGDQQETYRHVRAFTPADATDVDGYPVVVTHNKVRGRGRVLQLRFDGAATKDSHLLGYTVNYRAQAAI